MLTHPLSPALPPALPLGATIGMLGDGQLGRMLSVAASRLGFRMVVFGTHPNAPAAQVSAAAVVARYDDEAALKAFADQCDIVSLEFENIPAVALDILNRLGKTVAPGAQALRVTQDRLLEKTFAREQGVATVGFRAVDDLDGLKTALTELGVPSVLKTRRDGYDGKGQVWIRSPAEAGAALAALNGKPAILEAKADFVREISVVAARGWNGEMRFFPIAQNHHVDGILSTSLAPAPVSTAVTHAAHDIARRVLEGLDYVGVLAVELFVLADDSLVLNEIAPRVHNSGHWTQEGCVCDQFEQHIRAIAGWPLGDTTARCTVEMTNLLGEEILDWQRLSAEPNAQLHVYGKDRPLPGRKMGHINRIK